MKFFVIVRKIVTFIVLLLISVLEVIYRSTITSIKRGQYSGAYLVYGLFFAFVSMYLYRFNSDFANILRLIIALILMVFLSYVFMSIKRSNMEPQELYYQFMGWWFTSTLYLYFISILVANFTNLTINLVAVTFFVFIYYCMRYVLHRWIRNWFMYSLFFFSMPIISLFLWSFFGMFLRDLTGSSVFISDSVLGWMVLFISIILTNISVKWTPFERFDEVRVAMYFLLAVFSTISYCFFIADYLAAMISPYAESMSEILLTEQEIKEGIKSIITWGSLPYLIGSVFGCFTIELVSRNHNRQTKSN